MQTPNAITRLITTTMAVAVLAAAGLLSGAGWLQPVEAQSGDGSVKLVTYASIGIVPGEKVRLSVSNTAISPGRTVTWTYKVTNTGGVPLYESEWIQVPSGEFRCSDLSRRDLSTEGEPGTGRAEVMVKVTIQAPAGSRPEDFSVSAEVIKEETGATRGGPPLIDAHTTTVTATSIYVHAAALIGFIPGEKVRLSVGNNAISPGGTVTWTYKVTNTGNVPLYESGTIQVLPGEVSFSDVSRKDLNIEGEPGTGRAEVIAKVTIQAPAGSKPQDFSVSAEVIKEETGATSGITLGNILINEIGHTLGFIAGERLSFSVFNPPEAGGGPVRAQAYIYDATGRLITRSAAVDLQADQSHTFAFNRDDLPLAGEEGTRRLQVRAVIQVTSLDPSIRPFRLPVWVALVNTRTGGTTSSGTYFTGTVTVSDDGE